MTTLSDRITKLLDLPQPKQPFSDYMLGRNDGIASEYGRTTKLTKALIECVESLEYFTQRAALQGEYATEQGKYRLAKLEEIVERKEKE